MKVLFAAALLAMTLSACTAPSKTSVEPPGTSETTSSDELPPEPTEAEKADCTKQGGEMKRVGLMGDYACVIPTKDANKVCANDSDCEGACWITGHPAGPDPKARGFCQPTNMPFGCYGTLDKGVVSATLCVD